MPNASALEELIRSHQKAGGQVIIHMGSGNAFPGSKTGRVLGKNELHICIDIKHPKLMDAELSKKDSEQGKMDGNDSIRFEDNSTVVFVKARMQKTPLPDNCADSIHLENSFANHDPVNPSESEVLPEVKRLLKSGGIAQNVELYVPTMSGVHQWNDTLRKAELAGLRIEKIIEPLKQDASQKEADVFQEHLNRHVPRDRSLVFQGAYILRFRKE